MTSTGRIYTRVQMAFSQWCLEQGLVEPPEHEDVARYLIACSQLRGLSPVPVHLSAIADLFRSEGRYLDTKSPVIQTVMEPIREALKRERVIHGAHTKKPAPPSRNAGPKSGHKPKVRRLYRPPPPIMQSNN